MANATLVPVPPSAHNPLVRHADEVFGRVSPYAGDGFRNHCRRLFHFTTMLMQAQSIEFDRDVAYAVAMLHDLGLLSDRDVGHNYLQRSRALFEREMTGFDLAQTDPEILTQCLVYNHRMFRVPNVSAAAECFRRAVWIEHTRGIKRYGLDKQAVAAVFAAYPRDNFDAVLMDFTRRVLLREPLTVVNGIFF